MKIETLDSYIVKSYFTLSLFCLFKSKTIGMKILFTIKWVNSGLKCSIWWQFILCSNLFRSVIDRRFRTFTAFYLQNGNMNKWKIVFWFKDFKSESLTRTSIVLLKVQYWMSWKSIVKSQRLTAILPDWVFDLIWSWCTWIKSVNQER
jgi:hypothetical protein